MKSIFLIIIIFIVFGCKKYNCECETTTLSHFQTTTNSTKQISAVSKSEARKKCSKYNHQGSYGGEITTCELK